MCERGHAFFRAYEAGCWYLACCQCPHRILEGRAAQPGPPATVVVDLPSEQPEEQDIAA